MSIYHFLLALLLFSTRLQAQLPVNQEPHHKVILENAYFRLLEGNIPVNDTTAAHVHAANSVVIFLSRSIFGIQVVGDKPVITTVNPGDMKYVAYGDKPVNHIVWNQTPALFHFFVVELAKSPKIKDSCPTLTEPGVTVQFHEPGVTGYSLDVTSGHPFYLPPASCARLTVNSSSTQIRFFPPKKPVALNAAARYILLEIN